MRRIVELLAEEAASTAGTKVIDINTSDLLSGILVQFKGRNTDTTPTDHPAAMVSKIELVDGSEVLYSLSGKEIQALNYYEGALTEPLAYCYINDVDAVAIFRLNFGRHLWDKALAVNPARHVNLQLKITHNKAAGGAAPDAGLLSVFAMVMDVTDASPTGFLMAKEVQSYALVSSAHEYVSLPVDYAYRRLMILSRFADKQPWEQYNRIKLSVDNDKQVLINNMKTSDLLKVLAMGAPYTEAIMGNGSGSAIVNFVTPCYGTYISVSSLASALASVLVLQSYGGSVSITSDNDEYFQALVRGMAPHGAIELPFGVASDPATWLDTSKMASLKADITAGASVGSSSTCEIVVQQLRTYK